MRAIRVRDNNGSCCIRFVHKGQSYSLTQGSYSNPADVARMQRIALEVREACLGDAFTGLEQYRVAKVKATIEGILDALGKIDCPHKQAIIKLLLPFKGSTLTSEVIQQCFDKGTQTAASKRQYLSSLRTVFPEHKQHFEVTMVKDKKDTEKRDPFTDTEVNKILEAFKDSHYLALVKFQLMTGCRPSEAFSLRWSDIELSENRIRFCRSVTRGKNRVVKGTKTGKVRYFPLNSDLIALIRHKEICSLIDHSTSQALVFTNSDSCMIQDQTFRQLWERYLEPTGVRYRPPYTMRHTFISHCLARGVDVATVASWVGNSPEVIYKHYAGTINHATVPGLYHA